MNTQLVLLSAGTPTPLPAVAAGVLIVDAFTVAVIIDVRRAPPR